MLPRFGFVGELAGKTIHDFTSKLEYDLEGNVERTNHIQKILYTQKGKFIDKYFEEFFNQEIGVPHFKTNINNKECLSDRNFICNQIEYMTNYILFCKQSIEENKQSKYPYLNQNDKLQIQRRERSFDVLKEKNDKNGICILKKYSDSPKSMKLKPKQIITKKDIEDISYIAEIQKEIEILKEKLSIEEQVSVRNKIRRILKDLRKEQVDIKDTIKQPIQFSAILNDSTVFDFDSDTGYYKSDGNYEYVSYNRIDLMNYKHIYNLLKYYSDLKQQTKFNLIDDMKFILMDLDNLIEHTKLKDYEREILILKIDKTSGKEIIDYINKKYSLKLNDNYLSVLWRRVIPRKISEQYKKEYEEWFYTYKAKGDYKRCSKCKTIYLANNNYFGRNAITSDKLQSVCKKCDSERHILRNNKQI